MGEKRSGYVRGYKNIYWKLNAKGEKAYYYDVIKDGQRLRGSLRTTRLKEAKEKLDDIKGDNVDIWTKRKLDIAPANFWPLYEEHVRERKSRNSIDRERTNWDQFVAHIKPNTLGSVTTRHVQRLEKHWKHTRKQSNRTINDAMGRLQAIYNIASHMGVYGKHNPFQGFKRLRVEKKPPRFLTQEQLTLVLDKADAQSRDILLFCALCVYAGLRSNEAANTRWEWIDFESGTLTVQAAKDGSFGTKGKRFRSVPLKESLRDILEPIRKTEGYIVNADKEAPGKWRIRYEPKRAFRSVVEAAGVPWCTPHILRHTFASRLVQSGVSLYKVSQWLGHADMKTTQQYAHLAPADEDINAF